MTEPQQFALAQTYQNRVDGVNDFAIFNFFPFLANRRNLQGIEVFVLRFDCGGFAMAFRSVKHYRHHTHIVLNTEGVKNPMQRHSPFTLNSITFFSSLRHRPKDYCTNVQILKSVVKAFFEK